MDIVTIDFETYYDKEYSLSKMTTEAYIRDPRFEVIGVGVKVNDHPTDFYSGSDPGRFLKSLDYRDKAILCHNTAFDGFILSHHFGIRPKFWMDTMSMARPAHAMTSGVSLKALASFYSLGAKGDEVVNALGKRRADFSEQDMARYASYCVNDVDLTYQLFLRLRKGFPAIELRIIDLTLRMFTEPEIELNRAVLERYLAAVIARKEELLNAVEGVDKADLMSNPKMAQLLTQLNVIPPTKISARTGKETLAFGKTDKAFLDLLDHPDERVQTLVAARLGVKSTLAETRATSLIGVSERGRLPIMLNYYGAHTGRFCVVGDTEIIVLRGDEVLYIHITDLLPEDLVWDGSEFVSHGGLVDQGEREVMTYDGITGTPDHRVFCDEVDEAVELRVAAERGYTISIANTPERRRPKIAHPVS